MTELQRLHELSIMSSEEFLISSLNLFLADEIIQIICFRKLYFLVKALHVQCKSIIQIMRIKIQITKNTIEGQNNEHHKYQQIAWQGNSKTKILKNASYNLFYS